MLASISVAIVAVTVGLRLTHGSMTLMTGLVAILLAPEAYWPIRRVGAEFHSAADGASAITDILAALDEQPSTLEATTVTELGVELTGVTAGYAASTRPVLTEVTLSAGPGLTVVTGPSGVGKTTLLDVIAGLRRPSTGTVATGRVHYVTQRPFLTAGTLREALTFGRPATDEDLWAALRTVGLDGLVARLPQSLATPVGDDGFGFSAGQRARLALARATMSDAPVLLLDEPTAHLDVDSAALVHDVITTLADRRTVVAVTHRRELVALADQHLHLTPTGAELREVSA
jgi:ABC-type transport system involved in cytochrome bd biosynthesis fused ATPase/permease subunit